MIWESVQTKNRKTYENEKQFAWNAENLAIFKENDKRIWRCMNEMTRKLQKQIRSRCFGGPLKVGALGQWPLWPNGRYGTVANKEKSQNCVEAAIAFVCTSCKRQLCLQNCNW